MSQKIQFTRNYNDLSTDEGFQFEFYCDRCGTGYRTRFKPAVSGKVSQVLDAAGSLFGGVFASAANATDRARSAAWEKEHDSAFEAAVEEIKADFLQCPKCTHWVCRSTCVNEKRGLCKDCAPDLGVEMSVAQSERSVEEIHRHAAMADEDKKLARENWRETIRATCPKCEAPLAVNAKFCPECGEKLQFLDRCPECNSKLTPGARFCPECGAKLGQQAPTECSACGAELEPGAKFCPECGEKVGG